MAYRENWPETQDRNISGCLWSVVWFTEQESLEERTLPLEMCELEATPPWGATAKGTPSQREHGLWVNLHLFSHIYDKITILVPGVAVIYS